MILKKCMSFFLIFLSAVFLVLSVLIIWSLFEIISGPVPIEYEDKILFSFFLFLTIGFASTYGILGIKAHRSSNFSKTLYRALKITFLASAILTFLLTFIFGTTYTSHFMMDILNISTLLISAANISFFILLCKKII